MKFRKKKKYYLKHDYYGEITKEGCFVVLFWVIAFFDGVIFLFSSVAFIGEFLYYIGVFKSAYDYSSSNDLKTLSIMAGVSGSIFIISILLRLYFIKNDPSERKRQERRNWLIANGIEDDGKIIQILRKTEVKSAGSGRPSRPNRRIMYIFDAEYYDKEEHKYRTVCSEYYWNDIREVFADNKVKIYFNPNDKYDYIIDGMKLRQSDSEPAVEIPFNSWADMHL